MQHRGAALLLDGSPELVARTEADGAHLTGFPAFKSALSLLKPACIAGCGGLTSRHDAMLAAEAGADYVMFGEPDPIGGRPSFAAITDRVSWWAEVFESRVSDLPPRSMRLRLLRPQAPTSWQSATACSVTHADAPPHSPTRLDGSDCQQKA